MFLFQEGNQTYVHFSVQTQLFQHLIWQRPFTAPPTI